MSPCSYSLRSLEEWIAWRLAQATASQRLKRQGVPLFPNPSTGGRFGHDSLRRSWERAKRDAFGEAAPDVPLYSGTKHSTATELVRQGVDPNTLKRFLGHADQRSTDAYVVLANDDVKGLVRDPERRR